MKEYSYEKRVNGRGLSDIRYYIQSESQSHIVLCEKDSIKTIVLTKAEFRALINGISEGNESIILKEL